MKRRTLTVGIARLVTTCSFSSLLLAIFSCPLTATAKDKTVPAWLKEVASQPVPSYTSHTDAVVLLYDVRYTVSPDGMAVEHVREVFKLLRPQARERYGSLGAWYNGDSRLLSMQAWSIGADGHEYVIDSRQMSDSSGGEGFELYSDARYRSVRLPAADAGAVVALEFERQRRPYVTDYIFDTQRDIPVLTQRLTLEMPAGFTYKQVWKDKPFVQPINLENGRTLWEMKNVPAVDLYDVNMAPPEAALENRLDIHYSGPGQQNVTNGDWKSIGLWFDSIAAGTEQPSEAIRQKASQLTEGQKDFADRVQSIAEYVQSHVRYVAIEIGVGGYQPHAASDIYAHAYGDCKDKATLLISMLGSIGVHAYWVLVDTERGAIVPNAPSIAGNHMIAAIEVPAGYTSPKLHSLVTTSSGKHLLLFDPTWEKTPFGQIEGNLQGGYALLIDGEQSQAIQIPVLQPDQNIVRHTALLQLTKDGLLKGDVSLSESGDIASRMRYLYSSSNEKEQKEYLDRSVSHDLGNVTVENVKVANISALLQPLTLSYTVSAQDFARYMGPLLMLRPRVLGELGFPLDKKERQVPIALGRTRKIEDEYSITVPEGFTMDEMPESKKLDLGFAAYESSSEFKDGMLHYKRTFEVRDVSLPAEKYELLRLLDGVINTDEQATAILKHK